MNRAMCIVHHAPRHSSLTKPPRRTFWFRCLVAGPGQALLFDLDISIGDQRTQVIHNVHSHQTRNTKRNRIEFEHISSRITGIPDISEAARNAIVIEAHKLKASLHSAEFNYTYRNRNLNSGG